jgi:pimeloyl-ACP methyl ester carboxylesterase
MFDDPGLNRLYINVPTDQIEQLLAFRQNFPASRFSQNGMEWEYIRAGAGEQALLLLPGTLALAEASWQSIVPFSQKYTVIVPSYPPVKTMAELADGIAGILAREGIRQANVVGGAYGGLVAQVFVRRHPDKVRRLVLSHTGFPDRDRGAALRQSLRLLNLLPWSIVKAVFKRRSADLLPGDHPEAALSQAFYAEMLDYRLNKKQLLSVYARAVDLDLNHRFSPDDLRDWDGRVLILLSDDDPTIPPELHHQLLNLYPQAQAHIFHGAGRAASITRRDEYHAVIDAFFEAA